MYKNWNVAATTLAKVFDSPKCRPHSMCLKVEFLLKTDSGYPKDTRVTLFTLATPGNPFRFNTHRSAPPVSTLAHSRGPGAQQAEGI